MIHSPNIINFAKKQCKQTCKVSTQFFVSHYLTEKISDDVWNMIVKFSQQPQHLLIKKSISQYYFACHQCQKFYLHKEFEVKPSICGFNVCKMCKTCKCKQCATCNQLLAAKKPYKTCLYAFRNYYYADDENARCFATVCLACHDKHTHGAKICDTCNKECTACAQHPYLKCASCGGLSCGIQAQRCTEGHNVCPKCVVADPHWDSDRSSWDPDYGSTIYCKLCKIP